MEQFGDRAAAKQLRLREAILRRRGRGARPRWTETGGPPVKPPMRRGFGTPRDGQHDSRPTEG
jgi:hypothetical protein